MSDTDEVVYIYQGQEFETKEEMFEYAKLHPLPTVPKKTDNELLDEVLRQQFPSHDREIQGYLRRLKMEGKPDGIMEKASEKKKVPQWIKDMCMKDRIHEFFKNFDEFLCEKNSRYGNSVGQKTGTFFRGNNLDGVLLRLDDKLNRISNSSEARPNDYQDIIGYIALFCCLKAEEDPRWLDPRVFLD
jgi:hypothetical protein